MEAAPYTCNSCLVAFRTSEAQRGHMRSDWHRYNLKRQIASLPPLSSDTFNEKVLSAQASSSAAAAKASFETSCPTCQKTYFSQNAYQDHLGSKKHKLRVLNTVKDKNIGTQSSQQLETPSTYQVATTPLADDLDPEATAEFEKVVDGLKETSISESDPLPRRPSRPHHSASGEKEEYIPPDNEPQQSSKDDAALQSQAEVLLTKCIFCNYEAPTSKLNISHMSKIHGLFIPERDYLVDEEGLLRYLQAKVHQNHECLLCHKLKGTTGGVQTHMRDKGHCMIAFETEEEMIEVGQFYDFSSTYSDAESEDSEAMRSSDPVASGGVKLPKQEKVGAEDDGWETDSSFSSLDSAELTAIPIDDRSHQYAKLPLHRHHSHHDPRPHRNIDGFHSHAHHLGTNAVFHDEFELHLPSGRTAGHRNFKKYYRQNLRSYLSADERSERVQQLLGHGENEEEDMTEHPNALSTANGSQHLAKRSEAGLIGVTDSQRRELRASEVRGRRQAQGSSNRYQAKVEKQHNSQKHFRDPLLQ